MTMHAHRLTLPRAACAALLAALALSGPARAQAPEPPEAVEARLWEAMQASRWEEALAAYAALPAPKPRHAFLAAQAQQNLGQLERAAATLDELLRLQPGHIGALYMQARIRARQGRLDEARSLLRTSARSGQSVLRDLYAEADPQVFGPLLDDPEFLMTIMRESASWSDGQQVRDPFMPPSAAPQPGDPLEEQRVRTRVAEAEQRIRALLDAFRAESDRPQPDLQLLLGQLSELRAALAELERIAHPPVASRLDALRAEYGELTARVRPLQLHLYVSDGNQHLLAMASLLEREDYAGVLARYALLEELCAQMRAEPIESFRLSADQLMLRGDRLAARARLLQRAARLRLEVTGIVLAPDPAASSALVNDRILVVGDPVADPASGEAVPGLRLTAIARSAVTFDLEGVSFVRALKAR